MRGYLITGTSSGLGRAFFDLFVRENALLVAVSRRFLPEQEAAAGGAGERVRLVSRELSDEAQVPTAWELGAWLPAGELEEVVFINNAFADQPIGPVGALQGDRLAAGFRVNVVAPALLANALLGLPGVASGAVPVRLLNISAAAAKNVVPGWALYCASKAATEMFFEVAGRDHPGARVSVHNVNPGAMDTPMQERIRGSDFPGRERFVALKESGGLADPAEAARKIAVEYLGVTS